MTLEYVVGLYCGRPPVQSGASVYGVVLVMILGGAFGTSKLLFYGISIAHIVAGVGSTAVVRILRWEIVYVNVTASYQSGWMLDVCCGLLAVTLRGSLHKPVTCVVQPGGVKATNTQLPNQHHQTKTVIELEPLEGRHLKHPTRCAGKHWSCHGQPQLLSCRAALGRGPAC